MSIGYIYIRANEYWDFYNVYKLGKTSNIPDREHVYITSEIKKGKYAMVLEIDLTILDDIEKQLQIYFNELNLNIKFDAGIEFYNKEIINLIIPFFITNNIKYKILSEEEINNLIRKIKLNNDLYNPRDYQEIIINTACKYFQKHSKGILVLSCGVGKTLISLWITQKLNLSTLLIGVPNKLLLKQWKNIVCVLFKNTPFLIVSGNITIKKIIQFLKNNLSKCIIITTYASAFKVYSATYNLSFIFNITINDECHHLTSRNTKLITIKKYIQMLNIPSLKQLSLTATLKHLESDTAISNNSIEYFGEIIDRKCLLWAISNNIICDYVIQTIITKEEELINFHINDETDARLFLSAYASLKSIFDGYSHHILIYLNNKENSLKLIQYIDMLLHEDYFKISNLYYSNYHSEMKLKEQQKILNCFDKSQFGIIINIYCLNEGYDNNKIDAVVFAENMTSNIRIVQSALRASRKNALEPNKIAKIILPILNKEDWLENNNNNDLKTVREVIYQMGLEDTTIIQKIKVFNIEIKKHTVQSAHTINNFENYNDELTTKLKLKTIKRAALDISYEKAKKIIANENIKSKKEYFELCMKEHRLSDDPESIYGKQFINWIDYLSIERIYYDLKTCTKKVNALLISNCEIKKHYLQLSIMCNELCKLDNNFPPNDLWTDYYDVKDLRNIIIINRKKKGWPN